MNRLFKISMIAILLVISVLAMDIPVSQAVSETGVPTSAFPSSPAQEEAPPPNLHAVNQANHSGSSPVPPPAHDDSHFVQDDDGWLDLYLFQDSVPNGLLTFDIEIDRYYSPLITLSSVDANGFLLPSIRQDLINKHLLPERATLTLEVWDVDHEGSSCPEVDYVYINGQQVQDPSGTGPARLTSGNNTWSTWSISFPIEMLKFPIKKGSNGQRPTPAINEIAVEIDVLCGPHNWAVEVDWGSIHIPGPIRPIIFAHGWTGDEYAFDDFRKWALQDGIPVADRLALERGIEKIDKTSPLLVVAIDNATQEFGVDKLNLFAHSKGGLVSRLALRSDGVAAKIERLITFATPHHGTEWSDTLPMWLLERMCKVKLNTSDETTIQLCYEAARELGIKDILNNFNYRDCHWEWLSLPPGWKGCQVRHVQQSSVDYRSFATAIDLVVVPYYSTTYPWKSDERPFPTKANIDETYRFLSHGGLKENRNVYQCAISYIDPEIHGSFLNCPLLNLNSQLTATDKTTVLLVNGELQTVFVESGSVAANTTEVLEAYLDGTTLSTFDAYSTAPLGFTLTTPSGRVIDPSVAASDPSISYTFQEDGVWQYQYQITDPEAGTWQNVLYASDEADFFVWNRTQSTIQLNASTDIFTYRPGGLVILEAALSDGTTLSTGATITGQVTQPDDSTLTLPFYDDGTHGDATADDSIHTAQFNASSTNGHARIELDATQGNTTRSLDTSIAIATQTAQFQQVTNETPIDSNSNGLYDSLDLELSVDVIASGHFEFQGTLVDESEQLITTAFYSTRIAGTGPLPAGLQTITLSFDGEAIQQHGVDGPYTLTNLWINDVSDYSLEVDSATDVYPTIAYQADQFERSLLSLAGGSEEAMDADANGRYDQLTISVTLDVAITGTYSWNGRLVDHRGVEIGWAVGSGALDNQTPMVFTFVGERIGVNGEDGPYVLRDVSVFQTGGGNATALFEEAYSTTAYNYLDFEGGIPKVQYSAATYSVSESSDTAMVTVTLNAAWEQVITVDYASQDGTASAGSDYIPISGTLTFTPSMTEHVLTVTVISDEVDEQHETVTLVLSNTTNANLGIPADATLTILDDDGPTVAFRDAAYSVNEDAFTAAITVTLSASSLQTITVDYASQDGTASAGSDYETISSTLTFDPGVVEQTISITLIDDMVDEPDETILLALSNATNATPGTPTSATLTVVDNDLTKIYLPLILR